MRAIYPQEFFHDGRGPTLVAVHLARNSAHLEAIDFRLPDSQDIPSSLQHLRFLRAQAYMVTPEEVENYSNTSVNWGATGGGALVSLGRSQWLTSFSPRHLDKCEHFRVMFYDEFFDVICEDIRIGQGAYKDGL